MGQDCIPELEHAISQLSDEQFAQRLKLTQDAEPRIWWSHMNREMFPSKSLHSSKTCIF